MDIKQLIKSSIECVETQWGGCPSCKHKEECPVEYMSNGTSKLGKIKLIIEAYKLGKSEIR